MSIRAYDGLDGVDIIHDHTLAGPLVGPGAVRRSGGDHHSRPAHPGVG